MDGPERLDGMSRIRIDKCPFCGRRLVIGVHDDEGNFKGELGSDRGNEYENDPWSGLSYGLHHLGWGECLLCTDDYEHPMGGMLFDKPEDVAKAWNGIVRLEDDTIERVDYGAYIMGQTRAQIIGDIVREFAEMPNPEWRNREVQNG